MSQDKIESRRAFMKKLGKVAGAAAATFAFMAATSNNAEAKPDENNPPTGCWSDCFAPCRSGCQGTCSGDCFGSCAGTSVSWF